MTEPTRRLGRNVWAGCFDCWDVEAHWTTVNGQALAVSHARRYGHETWADVTLNWRYNVREDHPEEEATK